MGEFMPLVAFRTAPALALRAIPSAESNRALRSGSEGIRNPAEK